MLENDEAAVFAAIVLLLRRVDVYNSSFSFEASYRLAKALEREPWARVTYMRNGRARITIYPPVSTRAMELVSRETLSDEIDLLARSGRLQRVVQLLRLINPSGQWRRRVGKLRYRAVRELLEAGDIPWLRRALRDLRK